MSPYPVSSIIKHDILALYICYNWWASIGKWLWTDMSKAASGWADAENQATPILSLEQAAWYLLLKDVL